MKRLSRATGAMGTGLALAMAVALAACSSDADSGDGASGDGGGETQTLKVATIAFAQIYGEYPTAVKARLDQANANDEVPGYRFDYTGMIDDKYTTEGAVAAFRQAKEQDGVFAVVGNQSPLPPTDYVNAQKLPVVGAGLSQSFCAEDPDSSYFFAYAGCPGLGPDSQFYINLGQPAADLNGGAEGKTAACIGQDFPNGAEFTSRLCGSFEAAGYKIVLEDSSIPAPPAVTSDYSPWVQKAMTANDGGPVDVLGFSTATTATGGLASAMLRAGFEGLMIGGTGYAQPLVAEQKGVTQFQNIASPMSAADNPEMQKIVDGFDAAGISVDEISSVAIQGWLSADMFVQIAKAAAESGDLTPELFAETARTFTYEVDGVVGPTIYPNAFVAPTPCSELTQSDGKQWSVVRAFTCDQVFEIPSTTFVDYDSVLD